MIPADYFDRLDTSAKNSPVGKLMRKIQAAFPHLDLETMREESRASLHGVGGENRVSIAFNRFLRSQKLDNAPRRTRGNPATRQIPSKSAAQAQTQNQEGACV